jgi:opacity protein-like surface antigen
LVKLEYRHSSFSDGGLEVEGVSLNAEDAFDYVDVNRHQAAFGVGYRF